MAVKTSFGVQTRPQHTTWNDLREVWELLDTTGYDSAWTFDHFFPIMSDPTGPCLEGWILLAALAAETKNLRVGTLVTGNTYRHPAVLANMAATLDHTSGGRVNLGIGAAWFELEHRAYGIDFPPVGERIGRLDEACHVIRALWTETTANYSGKYYKLNDARCEPKPLQRPHPPIMIGGGGEKKTLRVVAEHANMWNWFGSVETFRQKIEILRGHCDAISRKIDEIEMSWAGEMIVTTKRESVIAEVAKRRQETVEEVESKSLIGTADEIEARIRQYISVGVRSFIISAGAPFDHVSLREFAESVIPRFR